MSNRVSSIRRRRVKTQENRIRELEREFNHDQDFIVEAISRWWTLEQAKEEYLRKKSVAA